MKTILFTYNSSSEYHAPNKNEKRYCFITDDDVKVGDVLKSPSYASNMHVCDVVEKEYKYVNPINGNLYTEVTSTQCVPIKILKLVETGDFIPASKVG